MLFYAFLLNVQVSHSVQDQILLQNVGQSLGYADLQTRINSSESSIFLFPRVEVLDGWDFRAFLGVCECNDARQNQ